MPKRAFERRNGELRDTYDEHGRTNMTVLPQSFLEPLSAEQRHEALKKTAVGGSDYALMEDNSSEFIEHLLQGLEANSISAPMSLSRFVEKDARIRPALLRAVRRVPARELANFVQVAGIVGGEGVLEVLSERLRELAVLDETMKDDAFFNFTAGALVSTAHALLELDPQNLPGGEQLVRVLREHPCAFNRRSAAMNAADVVVHRATRSTAMIKVRTALEECLDLPDDELVLSGARALFEIDTKRTTERITRVLREGKSELRERAAQALLDSWARWVALADVLSWLRGDASKRQRLAYASLLKAVLGEAEFERIHADALADESPSLRFYAAKVLGDLPAEARKRLASQALFDEPDPGLRVKLEELVKE